MTITLGMTKEKATLSMLTLSMTIRKCNTQLNDTQYYNNKMQHSARALSMTIMKYDQYKDTHYASKKV
jgi:hypothetical protein